MVLSADIDFKNLNLFENPRETPITKMFKYKQTCMGGTFDHMHLGHKLLITQACLVTNEMLHIGITGDALLQKKAYSEFLETFERRKSHVLNFISVLYPHIKVNIFELSDPIGIAGTDPKIEACVLTREVEKGGKMINDARAKNGLGSLDLLFVDMILADADSSEKNYSNKLSSTNIREYLS
jgi:cytidyltransferase-like protein